MTIAAYFAASRRRAAALLAALAAALLVTPALAQDTPPAAAPAAQMEPVAVGANLNISPKRLTFDRSGKSATVYIFNQGTTTATFDINLVDRVMQPSGQISPVSEFEGKPEFSALTDRLKSAQPVLLATPRRATLEPGKGQTIRVRVNPGAETTLGPGEYRSHLTVTTIPPRDLGVSVDEAAAAGEQELKFTVYSVFGISIPVVVRLGATDVRAAIENPRITYADLSADGVAPATRTAVLNFDLARTGANSLFGNVEIRGANAKEPIGFARGVGVYTEIDRRHMEIPLTRAPQPGETLEIVFTDDDTAPGRVLAQSAFTTP